MSDRITLIDTGETDGHLHKYRVQLDDDNAECIWWTERSASEMKKMVKKIGARLRDQREFNNPTPL